MSMAHTTIDELTRVPMHIVQFMLGTTAFALCVTQSHGDAFEPLNNILHLFAMARFSIRVKKEFIFRYEMNMKCYISLNCSFFTAKISLVHH